MGLSALKLDATQFALPGAYWGVLYGWVPALIAVSKARQAVDNSSFQIQQADPPPKMWRSAKFW